MLICPAMFLNRLANWVNKEKNSNTFNQSVPELKIDKWNQSIVSISMISVIFVLNKAKKGHYRSIAVENLCYKWGGLCLAKNLKDPPIQSDASVWKQGKIIPSCEQMTKGSRFCQRFWDYHSNALLRSAKERWLFQDGSSVNIRMQVCQLNSNG